MKTIKLLEEIGKSKSLNQYESIQEMLKDLSDDYELTSILNMDNDLVCGIFQEDEDEEEEEETEKK